MSAETAGEIRTDTTYTIARVKEITGLGEGALRAMRRRGLAVKYVAGRGFVSGRALAEFIENEGKSEK